MVIPVLFALDYPFFLMGGGGGGVMVYKSEGKKRGIVPQKQEKLVHVALHLI